MTRGNLLSNEALEQVRQVVREVQGSLHGSQPYPQPTIAPGPECFLGYFPSGCTALSGSTPGTGTANLYRRNTSDGTLEALLLTDGETANTRTVYNASGTAVSSSAYSPVWRDKLGTWWVAPWGGGSRPTIWKTFKFAVVISGSGSPRSYNTFTLSGTSTFAHPQITVAGSPQYATADETFYFPYMASFQVAAISTLTTTTQIQGIIQSYNVGTGVYSDMGNWIQQNYLYADETYGGAWLSNPVDSVGFGVGTFAAGRRIACKVTVTGDTSAEFSGTVWLMIGPKIYTT